MAEETKVEEAAPTDNTDLVNKLVDKITGLEDTVKVELSKVTNPEPVAEEPKVEEPVAEKTETPVEEPAKEPVVEPVVEEAKEEPAKVVAPTETVAENSIPTIVENKLDDSTVDAVADKLLEKIKPSLPQPVTINEFDEGTVDTETNTANRLAESLAKI